MKEVKFKIYTLGCKVNQYDGNDLAAKLTAAGFVMVKNGADLAIINTCAVTKTALAKDRQMVARARKENPRAKIVVVGCATRVYKEAIVVLGADLVIEAREAEEIVDKISKSKFLISKQIQNPKSKIQNFDCNASSRDKSIFVRKNKSRYFLKVQDGCRQFCTYCVIPYARGELKSRPAGEVITEVKRAVNRGYKEIVLCGIHLGLYGFDLKTQNSKAKTTTQNSKLLNLVGLLNELIRISGLGRIRLSSIEVNEVTDELIGLIKRSGKICRHLHIPLQSGNDKILKLMNRPYTTKIFADKIKKIRQAMPDTCPVKSGVAGARDSERFNGVAISTDVIVGFPGESMADHRITEAFVKKMRFCKVHVFPFSAHERTPAANMIGQVRVPEKTERSKRLNGLSAKLESEYQKKFKGKKLSCIIDGRSKDGLYRAKTEYHFDIEFSSGKKYFPGDLIEVQDWRLLRKQI